MCIINTFFCRRAHPRQPQNLKSTAAPAIPQGVSRESAAGRREELALHWSHLPGFLKPSNGPSRYLTGTPLSTTLALRHSFGRPSRFRIRPSDEFRELTVTLAVSRSDDERALERYCRNLPNRKVRRSRIRARVVSNPEIEKEKPCTSRTITRWAIRSFP